MYVWGGVKFLLALCSVLRGKWTFHGNTIYHSDLESGHVMG